MDSEKMFSLEQAARICGGTLNSKEKDRVFTGISIDTRTLRPGDLFIALQGPRFDGHSFVSSAFQKNAAAAVVSRPVDGQGPQIIVPDTLLGLHRLARWYRGLFSHPVVAVTGSAGKTTTKACIATVLSQVFQVRAGFGNWNNHIGVPMNMFSLRPEDQCFVLELGANHPGEIRVLSELAEPTVGVLTGVQPTHLEGFGSLDNIYRAKLELADYLETKNGTLIANGDDPELRRRLKKYGCPVITFGADRHCDFQLSGLTAANGFVCFEVNGTLSFRLAGYGAFNAFNALASIAVAGFFKLDLNALAESWQSLPNVEGRFQVFYFPSKDLQIVDDSYNANPQSFERALESFQALADERKKTVICGDMLELGSEGGVFHEQLGRSIAQAGVERLIGVGPLSRLVVKSFLANCPAGEAEHVSTAEDALEAVKKMVRDGDALLIKGSHGIGLGRLRPALESLWAAELASPSVR